MKFLAMAKQHDETSRVSLDVGLNDRGGPAVLDLSEPPRLADEAKDNAEAAVAALYQASAVGLIRLAYVMLGDRQSAEDVVQEAFCGLYRQWSRLRDADRAMYYLRASVLNGCRSALRRRVLRRKVQPEQPPAVLSAEAVVLNGEEREEVFRAVGRLPHRQREALVLRFYLDLSDDEIARVMGISPSTVRSTMHRALGALGRVLQEAP
jgi:RNA polymerase sigma-70 factor (sigma-E family)